MPSKGSGKNVTQKEIAELFGVTVKTVGIWASKGCPIVEQGKRGQANVFNTAAVFEWRVKQTGADNESQSGPTLEQVKIRQALAAAEEAEMDLAERKGQLVHIEGVAQEIEREYSVIRALFLSMPGELSSDLEHKETHEVEEILSSKITEILNELSADEQHEATAEAEGSPAEDA